MGNIWGADLADFKTQQGHRFMLCVIDVYSKYTVVVSLKDKNVETIVNTFKNKNK